MLNDNDNVTHGKHYYFTKEEYAGYSALLKSIVTKNQYVGWWLISYFPYINIVFMKYNSISLDT